MEQIKKELVNKDCGRLVSRLVVVGAAGTLAYIGATCPCKPNLYSCHLSHMYVSLLVVLAVLIWHNGSRVQSYTPKPQ